MDGRGRYALAMMLAMMPLSARAGDLPQRDEEKRAPRATLPVGLAPPLPPVAVVPPPPVVWPTVPSGGVRPKIIGNPGDFFGSDEYPPAAIRAEEEGRTVARILVDPSGTPQVCEVTTSSGSVELDKATCRIARARLRFTPAHDAQGKALAGVYVLPVRWVLPEPDPVPRLSFAALTRAELTAAGEVISCTTSGTGVAAGDLDEDICAQIRQDPAFNRHVMAPLGDGKRATIWVQNAMTFDGDPAIVEEHKRPGHIVIGLARAHLTIAPNGSVTACEMVEQSGQLGTGQLCRNKPGRFLPITTAAKGGATVLVAFSMAPGAAPAAASHGVHRGGRAVRRRR